MSKSHSSSKAWLARAQTGLKWARTRIPHWTQLRLFGGNRLMKTSYFWLVFVPIAARLTEKLNPDVKLHLWGHDWKLTLQLPFSWQVFFFSSLALAIASAIFAQFCPPLIRHHKSYTEFDDAGGSSLEICSALARGLSYAFNTKTDEQARVHDALNCLETAFRPWCSAETMNAIHSHMAELNRQNPTKSEIHLGMLSTIKHVGIIPGGIERREAFAIAVAYLTPTHEWARLACGFFYAVGLALLAIVFAQNVWWVLISLPWFRSL